VLGARLYAGCGEFEMRSGPPPGHTKESAPGWKKRSGFRFPRSIAEELKAMVAPKKPPGFLIRASGRLLLCGGASRFYCSMAWCPVSHPAVPNPCFL
jgi:hypothetical protein